MARRLKVFRTPAGFHDAYVAAPSRKAALAAWGATADLFARGLAEEVTEPALMEAPLAAPGTVVRRSRGTAAEQLAVPAAKRAPRRAAEALAKRAPKPDRAAVDAAEAALKEAERAHRTERRALAERQAALDREAKATQRRQETERAGLERARDAAAGDYDRALKMWRG
jgi:hypothetical protein